MVEQKQQIQRQTRKKWKTRNLTTKFVRRRFELLYVRIECKRNGITLPAKMFFSPFIILIPLYWKIASRKWTKSHLQKQRKRANNFQPFLRCYSACAYSMCIYWHSFRLAGIMQCKMCDDWIWSLEIKRTQAKNPFHLTLISYVRSQFVCFSHIPILKPLGKMIDWVWKKCSPKKSGNMNRHKKKIIHVNRNFKYAKSTAVLCSWWLLVVVVCFHAFFANTSIPKYTIESFVLNEIKKISFEKEVKSIKYQKRK